MFSFSPSFQKGLSMMEVMIVLAIMALFAGVVGPKLFTYLSKGKIATTKTMLHNTKQAIDSFHIDTGKFPESLADLIRKPLEENIAKKWQGPYLDVKDDDYIPVDGWGNELVYHRSEPGSGKPYELYSDGPDGEDSPEDARIYG
jgi:general secretion pathway protein G